VIDERLADALPGVVRVDGDLLDVGAAVDEGRDQVGDRGVGVVDVHPRPPVLLEAA
jgi:hypothetical protein